MRKRSVFIIHIILLSFSGSALKAQFIDSLKPELELQMGALTNSEVPFWMRSNQYGSVPTSGLSASILGRVYKPYKAKSKLLDWGFGFEGRLNTGTKSDFKIIESYIKGRLSIFQLKFGRDKNVMGFNADTVLSSGNFSVSGNSLGIPSLELSIPEYYRIPIFDGLFSFKGNFRHGWLGKVPILDRISYSNTLEPFPIFNTNPRTYLHQKSLYGRFGKSSWAFNLFGGFNHQVFWGNEQAAYGPNFKLSPLETFFYVATGKTYGTPGVPTSKIGNQLGSIDIGAEYKFSNYKLTIFRQAFYDVGALSKLANINDGLTGLSIENIDPTNSSFRLKKVLLEYFFSKDQAGYPWSKPTKSGDEDYYNNFYYINGWSYKASGIGNPLITPKALARPGQASRPSDYFINNRVSALHLGILAQANKWHVFTKITYSRNFGTFGTSEYGKSTGSIRNPQNKNLFTPVTQVSTYLEAMRPIQNKLHVGFAAALDQGKLLNNSFGVLLKAKYQM